MRERNFIAQNKEKWKELEDLMKENRKDPDKLTRLFIQVTDDLSFARTFYPNRYVRVYLNSIAQQLFYTLYKNKRTDTNRFIFFWKEELPRLVYAARKELLFSLIFFIVSVIIGVVSTINVPEFPSVILGPDYIQMTMENIKKGDPMGVYKKMNEADMFLGITLNNLYVSFITFLSGVVYCIGSIGTLMYNGVMIGVFQYFFYRKHLLLTSMLTIWLHGTLEISSIIIAAGAGITMGRGLIFPGTHSRAQSFFLSARRGIKILVGILPIIVIAAIIESFLTRYTEMPSVIKAGLIFASLSFVLFYFVWYPIRKNRESLQSQDEDDGLQPSYETPHDFSVIHSNGMIFREIFTLFKKEAGRIFRWSLFLATIASGIAYYFYTKNTYYLSNRLLFFGRIFDYSNYIVYYFMNTGIFSIIFFVSMRALALKANPSFKTGIASFLKVLFFSAFINSFFFMPLWLCIMLILIVGPFYLQWLSVSFFEKKNLFSSFSKAFALTDASIAKAFGFFLVALLSGVIFFFLIDSPLLQLYIQTLKWNFSFSAATLRKLDVILAIFTPYFSMLFLLPLILFGNCLEYFTLKEIYEANGLSMRIRKLKHSHS